MTLKSAVCLLAVSASIIPGTAVAQLPPSSSPSSSTLRTWLELRFADMGRNCLGDKFKIRKKGSAVPSEVLRWGAIEPYLAQTSAIHPASSMSTVLAQPFTLENNVPKPFGAPLTITWPTLLAPTLDAGTSEGRQVQNCSTLVTSNADLKVDVPIVKAALDGSRSASAATTNYIYAGRIVSPFTWAISGGGNPASTPPMSRFSVLLGIWDWYRHNPAAAARTDIALRSRIDGLAIYSVQGINQQTLLSGDADVRFGMPFLSGGASSRGTASYNVIGEVKDYASVVMRDQEYGWLPGAAQIAALARGLGRVRPVVDNPTATDGLPFRYAIEAQDVPVSMCDAAQWTPTIAVDNFSAQPLAGAICRFQGEIRPGPSTGATFPISFGVESVIAATPPVRLILATPPASLTDERALLSLNIVQVPAIALDAGAAESVSIPLNFTIIERGGASALALSKPDSAIRLSCGNSKPAMLIIERYAISRDSSEPASLLLVVQAPASAFDAVTSSTRCQADGIVAVSRRFNGRIGDQEIRLPSVAFDAVRKPQPPQPAAPGM